MGEWEQLVDPHQWGDKPFHLTGQDIGFALRCGCVLRFTAVVGSVSIDQAFHGAMLEYVEGDDDA